MLNFQDVSIRRGARVLVEHATFSITRGTKAGLTGRNGTGKSSLFQLIRGELSADSGRVDLAPDLVISHVAQETPAVEQPAIEYVIDGDQGYRELENQLKQVEQSGDGIRLAEMHAKVEDIDGYTIRARAARLMAGLGFDDVRARLPVASLSGGWRMRLNLARALICRSDVLLLDEPTNHLDLDAVIWLQDWLKDYPGTLLLISHDRDFLDSIIRVTAHIENRSIRLYSGNYSFFEQARAENLAQQQALWSRQQKEIEHIRGFVSRFRAKATKAKQVQSRLKALDRMELISQAHADSPVRFEFRDPENNVNPLVKLEHLQAGYGEHTVISGASLVLSPGDRVGLLGPNGAGKSTLIKLLAGDMKPQRGKIRFADDIRIGYFAQHQLDQLHIEQSPLQHLQSLDQRATEKDLRNYLGGFGFGGDDALEPVSARSGGQKARLVLALLAYQRPNILLLDEPTNHLDMDVRHALSVALQNYSGALLIVSHDRHLLRTVTDRFYLVASGSVSAFDGDLEDYRDQLVRSLAQASGAPESLPDVVSRKQKRRDEAQRRRTLQPLQDAVKQAESTLEEYNGQRARLEVLLADPGLYESRDQEKLQTLVDEKRELERMIDDAEKHWFDVCQKLEEAKAGLS